MKRYLPFAALFVGLVMDVLFWKKAPGISFTIFIILCLALGFWLLHLQHIRPARNTFFLLIPILIFCALTFVRKDPLTTFLNYVLTLFSVAVLAMTFRSGNWIAYNVRDYLANFFQLIGSLFVHPKDLDPHADPQQAVENPAPNRKLFLSILRGILLALPVLFIFTLLLSSADMVFAQKLDDLFANFRMENISEYLFRGSYILLSAYFFIGLIRHAAARSQQEKLINADKSLFSPFLGFTESSIILGSVILLFSVFVTVQFRYLFFGESNITLTGLSLNMHAVDSGNWWQWLFSVCCCFKVWERSRNTRTSCKKRSSPY